MQVDFMMTVILPLAVFIIMFGLGLSLQVDDFVNVLKQPKAALVGLTAQLIALPLFAFGIALFFLWQL